MLLNVWCTAAFKHQDQQTRCESGAEQGEAKGCIQLMLQLVGKLAEWGIEDWMIEVERNNRRVLVCGFPKL